MQAIAVIDFETTGISPGQGDRATEVAIVLLQHGRVVAHNAAHRALADADMAAALLGHILRDLRVRHGIVNPDHALLMALQRCAKLAVPRFLAQQRTGAGS